MKQVIDKYNTNWFQEK